MRIDRWVSRGLRATMVVGLVGSFGGPALAAEGINPHADEILRAMSKFLAGTPAFSVSGVQFSRR